MAKATTPLGILKQTTGVRTYDRLIYAMELVLLLSFNFRHSFISSLFFVGALAFLELVPLYVRPFCKMSGGLIGRVQAPCANGLVFCLLLFLNFMPRGRRALYRFLAKDLNAMCEFGHVEVVANDPHFNACDRKD